MHRVPGAIAPLLIFIGTASGCAVARDGRAGPATVAAKPEEPGVVRQHAVPPPEPRGPSSTAIVFDAADLAEHVRPTVVNITTTQTVRRGEAMDLFEFFFGPQTDGGHPRTYQRIGAGSGFILDARGLVVTNAHVVEGADELRVKLADGREFVADVVGRDRKLDVAVIRLRGATRLPVATLGSSERLRVGEHVLAVGNPFGLGNTVTLGIVSAKARAIGAGPYDDFIQTDASINPGNSGGPLFNARGEVVGISTAIVAGGRGIGFAIPIDAAKEILPQLETKGYVERGKLGISFQHITSDLANVLKLDSVHGALIDDLLPGGAGARAGLLAGDVVVAVDDKPIVVAEDLSRMIGRHGPGQRIALTVIRNGARRDLVAILDRATTDVEEQRASRERSSMSAEEKLRALRSPLGVRVADAPQGGAEVEEVVDPSRAPDLEPGDVIVQFDQTPIRDGASLRIAASRVAPGSLVLVRVRHDKQTRFATIRIAGSRR